MAIVNDTATRDIVWILDVLDECERKSLEELIKALAVCFDSRSRANAGRSRCSFKVVILSRPHNFIQQKFRLARKDDSEDASGVPEPEGHCRMRLVAEEESIAIARDIALFVRSKLVEFGENSNLVPNMLQRRLHISMDLTLHQAR